MLIRGRESHHNASRCIGIAHGINSCAAIHLVGSSAADDHVIASTTVDDIVACITGECVIECRAGEIFNREKSVTFSVTALACACQQAHSHRSCGCGIIRRVHTVTANQFVGTRATDEKVIACAAIQGVIASIAIKCVVTAAAIDGVIPISAVNGVIAIHTLCQGNRGLRVDNRLWIHHIELLIMGAISGEIELVNTGVGRGDIELAMCRNRVIERAPTVFPLGG